MCDTDIEEKLHGYAMYWQHISNQSHQQWAVLYKASNFQKD